MIIDMNGKQVYHKLSTAIDIDIDWQAPIMLGLAISFRSHQVAIMLPCVLIIWTWGRVNG